MITRKSTFITLFLFALAISGLALITPNSSQAQRSAITGDWRIEFTRKDANEVQLTIMLGSEPKSQNWGSGIAISDVQGLSSAYASGSYPSVTLRVSREAGTLDLVGSFNAGKGQGRFTLTPNESFFAALAARGYGNLTDKQVFSAVMANMKIASIDELKAAGYDGLTFNKLIEASIFNVNTALIADLRSAGFDQLPFNKLVEARIFKVDAAFAQQAESYGFGKLPFNKLVELRVHKISPEYINEIQQMGFRDLNLNRVVEFKIFQINPQFVSDVRAAGFPSITPQQLVNLRVFKIDGDFIRQAKSQNPSITIEQLVEMRIHARKGEAFQ